MQGKFSFTACPLGGLWSSRSKIISSEVMSPVWNAKLQKVLYVAHDFITLNNIVASLLHINCTCFVASKIKEWHTFLIYGACFVVHQEWKSKIFYTFIVRVSSHHCLKNEICYSFISLVLPHDGLKNKVYYTHSLFKKNQHVYLCPSTDKIRATWRSIWGDLQSSQVKHTTNSHAREFWNFYSLSFPEFDVNVFEAVLSIQRFSIWPNKEKFS